MNPRISCGVFLTIVFVNQVFGESPKIISLDNATHEKCLGVLRDALKSDEFWPAIHAAEGLTLGGYGKEVREFLEPKLATEKDDQRRCGIARELVRAGDRAKAKIMLDILAGDDSYGHIHAAESLYKVGEIGDGKAMKRAFKQKENIRLRIMSAGALGRNGNITAMAFLREQLSTAGPDVFYLSAWILGRIGAKQDIEPMRKRIADASVLNRAYIEHSLATLGDKRGLAALSNNLESDDGSIRTYAATFAGDARTVSVAPKLKKMLDDTHLDARIRAAQSLLVLSRKPKPHDEKK